MRAFRRSRFLLVVTLVAAIGAGAAAIALADTPGSPVEQLQSHPGPEAFLAPYGVSASERQAVFTLDNGQTVSVIDKESTRCLLHGKESQVVGRCFSAQAVNAGEAVTVSDECGSSGSNLMEITGLAPEGATNVKLSISNGTSQETSVVDGAFRFQGTNPGQGDPYPTGVEWLSGSGGSTGSAGLPVNGDEFCEPTS